MNPLIQSLIVLVLMCSLTVAWNVLFDRGFRPPALMVHNYRGEVIPTARGVVIPLAIGTYAAMDAALFYWFRGSGWRSTGGIAFGITAGFAMLGLIDDIGGEGQSFGFRGHLRALRAGAPTTGLIKMIGGGVLALAFTADPARPHVWIASAAVIALSANAVNMTDRAPGRASKVSILWALCNIGASLIWMNWDALGWDPHGGALLMSALILGVVAALLPGDLGERFMLGDSGSNALGAVLGAATLIAFSEPWIPLALVLVFNVLAESVSLSSVIDRVAVLRWFDRLGSRRA